MRTKTHHRNRFMRIITIPIRVLCKARDCYVKSMTDVGDRVSYGSVILAGGHVSASLPRSFSVSSSKSDDNEDLRELIRAISTRTMGNRADMDLYLQQQMRHQQMRQQSTSVIGSKGVPRSCSVGMGRIDEDRPSDFGEEDLIVRPELMYPRSRSYAVTKGSVVF